MLWEEHLFQTGQAGWQGRGRCTGSDLGTGKGGLAEWAQWEQVRKARRKEMTPMGGTGGRGTDLAEWAGIKTN